MKTGLKRNTIDKYYTKESVVELVMSFWSQHITLSRNDLVIEPSAGNGAFIPEIKKYAFNYVFYDIEPENDEIVKQDYLQYQHVTTCEKIHVIGNPPFGRQSSMAIKFIKKSCEFCDTISFVLPRSFRKDSMKKAFSCQFHLIAEMELPTNSFYVDGLEYDVPCVFQIWEKQLEKRQPVEKKEPMGFEFVTKSSIPKPHISVRRVGVNAGMIDTEIEQKSIQSHYFIRFTCKDEANTIVHVLRNKIHFEFNNTVGPRSISKQELTSQFNSVLVAMLK